MNNHKRILLGIWVVTFFTLLSFMVQDKALAHEADLHGEEWKMRLTIGIGILGGGKEDYEYFPDKESCNWAKNHTVLLGPDGIEDVDNDERVLLVCMPAPNSNRFGTHDKIVRKFYLNDKMADKIRKAGFKLDSVPFNDPN
jgi:hypothetical protein